MQVKRGVAVLFLLAASALATSALGAPEEDARTRAAAAYKRGVAAHDRGDLQTAARELALADAIAPNPVALRAAIDAAVDADDPALGMELLERAKRGAVDEALGKSIETAKTRFAGRAGRVEVSCPERATCLATLDGTPIRIATPEWTRTGQHTVVVQVDGASQTKLVEVGPNDVTRVVPTAAPKPEPAAPVTASPPVQAAPTPEPAVHETPVEEKPRGWSRAVFFVATGFTAAAGLVTLASAKSTADRHADFVDAGCARAPYLDCTSLKEDGQAAQTRTNVMLVTTGGLAVVSAVIGIFLTDWSPRGTRPAAPSATLVPGGAMGGWSGRF